MEVTRSNLKECLGEIEDAINSADFIAIDGEFTGLSTQEAQTIGAFDTPEERYLKLKKGASDFLLIQFGLAAFTYDAEEKKYSVRPFNMYVFPRPFSRQAPDRRFMCQSSSIDFLVSQGFDFNKLFREGLPYLTSMQEKNLKDSIEKKYAEHAQFSSPAFTSPHGAATGAGPHKGPVEVPDEQKQFIDDTCKKIKEFIADAKEESLKLDVCSAFQRKLIYQTARLKFNNIHLDTKLGEKKERYIVVSLVKSEEDLKAREKAKMEAEMAEVDEAVGFCKVTKMLSQSGKLIVGHNMLLDMIHTVNQFFFPLPEKYEDFKGIVKCVFPRLLDTKLMASTAPFKELIFNTALGDLRKIIEAKPFVKPQVEISEKCGAYCTTTEFLHEAGYDAYITGLVFIGMANHLGTYQQPEKEHISPKSPLIEPFVNKLFMMRVNDIPYLNLAGNDLEPNRGHVFHVTFPKEWKMHDIVHLFAPYGSVSVSWLNEVSAFVALYRKENAPTALKGLTKGQNSSVTVVTYKSFKMGTLEKPSPLLPRKRKLSASDLGSSKRERSISPIPEEDETETPEKKEEEKMEVNLDTDLGPTSDKKAKKMFEEPEVW